MTFDSDEEPEEPKLTVLTKQHKDAIRAIRKVGVIWLEERTRTRAQDQMSLTVFSCLFAPFLLPLPCLAWTDQVLRCTKKVQRSP